MDRSNIPEDVKKEVKSGKESEKKEDSDSEEDGEGEEEENDQIPVDPIRNPYGSVDMRP